MNLINKSVFHITFGKGTIVKQESSNVTVEFFDAIGHRVFQYPEGFEHYLKLNDELLSDTINNTLQQKREVLEKEKAEKLKTWGFQKKKENSKSSKKIYKGNIALKYNFCDGGSNDKSLGYKGVCTDAMIKHNIIDKKHTGCCSEDSFCLRYLNNEISRDELKSKYLEGDFACYESQMLNNWRAHAGIVQTGVKKGQPMAFRDLPSDMLAILTTRLPGMKEKERLIYAIFLVKERSEGDEEIEGYIEANPDYRIELSLDEATQVKFWNYYFNEKKPEVIRMGSSLHQYITDNQAIQILKKIIEVKQGKEEKEYVMNFLKYFSEVKKLDVDSIPEPEGGLTRIDKDNVLAKI